LGPVPHAAVTGVGQVTGGRCSMTGIMTPDPNGREGGTDNGHETLSIPSDTTDQNNARAAVSIPRLIGTSDRDCARDPTRDAPSERPLTTPYRTRRGPRSCSARHGPPSGRPNALGRSPRSSRSCRSSFFGARGAGEHLGLDGTAVPGRSDPLESFGGQELVA